MGIVLHRGVIVMIHSNVPEAILFIVIAAYCTRLPVMCECLMEHHPMNVHIVSFVGYPSPAQRKRLWCVCVPVR